MNKTATILIAVALMLLLPVMATAQTVEIDNFMPATESYCYNAKVMAENPGDKVAIYRLELLTQAYSANGRISGLEAGIKARSGINCADLTFVNNIPDWLPRLEHAIT